VQLWQGLLLACTVYMHPTLSLDWCKLTSWLRVQIRNGFMQAAAANGTLTRGNNNR